METEKSKNAKKHMITGQVVSDKMDKTIVVNVERTFKDPLIRKVVRTLKKYKVHDEEEKAKVGDMVEIYQGRPQSKTKYMYLSRVIRSQAK